MLMFLRSYDSAVDVLSEWNWMPPGWREIPHFATNKCCDKIFFFHKYVFALYIFFQFIIYFYLYKWLQINLRYYYKRYLCLNMFFLPGSRN